MHSRALPLVVRALDLSRGPQTFSLVLGDSRASQGGARVQVTARLVGEETVTYPGGPIETEKIELAYAEAAPSLIGETTGQTETYWRAKDPSRTLVKLEGATYTMTLVEAVRAPYWSTNIFPDLARVTERP